MQPTIDQNKNKTQTVDFASWTQAGLALMVMFMHKQVEDGLSSSADSACET